MPHPEENPMRSGARLPLTAVLLSAAAGTPLLAQPQPPSSTPLSIAVHVRLEPEQVAELDDLYHRFSAMRRREEALLADCRAELRQVEAQTPPDARRSQRILRAITASETDLA
jgi:hypothetical protein